MTSSMYLDWFHGAAMKIAVCRGGILGLMAKHATTINGNMIKATIRILQANPISELFSIFDKAIGKTTPPIEDPETMRPSAAARLLSKY